MLTLTFLNPQIRAGPFDGLSVLDGTMVGDFAEPTFEVSGSVFFLGEVEGCGEERVFFRRTTMRSASAAASSQPSG